MIGGMSSAGKNDWITALAMCCGKGCLRALCLAWQEVVGLFERDKLQCWEVLE